MKIVFNTRSPEEAASAFYGHALSKLDFVVRSDWDNYDKYDVALFMQHPADISGIDEARKKNPNLKIGLVDPRGKHLLEYVKKVDFLVVNSLEKKDFFVGAQRNIFLYHEYPEIPKIAKKHVDKKKIIIGYHGNKVHLAGIFPNITLALEALAQKYDIEFWAMYNIRELGQWTAGAPCNVPIKHIQWSMENYHNELAQVDIGIVPNFMPTSNASKLKSAAVISRKYFLDRPEDYLVRYKVPSNAGRAFIFSRLGIPVVADMFPSAVQFIQDGYDGYLACHSGAWHVALESLVKSASLRQEFADRMDAKLDRLISFDVQNRKFVSFLESIVSQGDERPSPSIELMDGDQIPRERMLSYRKNVFNELYINRYRRKFSTALKKLKEFAS